MKPDSLYVTALNGEDTYGLWSLDLHTRPWNRSTVAPTWTILGVRTHSKPVEASGQIVGVAYFTDKYRFEYFDEVEAATYAQLESIIPYSHYVRIRSRSRDGATMIVHNVGPRDPGSYYLLKDGKLEFIEGRNPKLRSENLADLKRIEYKSRDGLTIPAFLTVPHGEPPFPSSSFHTAAHSYTRSSVRHEWAQLLANNRYLVLQPQYRGSQGYGMKFYTAAFEEGGEGGYAMQDGQGRRRPVSGQAGGWRTPTGWRCSAGPTAATPRWLPQPAHRSSTSARLPARRSRIA